MRKTKMNRKQQTSRGSYRQNYALKATRRNPALQQQRSFEGPNFNTVGRERRRGEVIKVDETT
jgi:hypothetical protein